MPRPPATDPATDGMPGAVYTPFAERARGATKPLAPLHVGDTYLAPFEGARVQDIRVEDHERLHNYSDTRGLPALVDALVEKARTRNGLACERDSVLVTAGATAGLGCAIAAIASPGDEVLILSPFWPLIRGIVQAFRARPVEVPFYDRVDSAEAAVAAVRGRLGPRSVALYVSTPSNPTGRLLPRAWLEALAELARCENLWLLSDEVYEDIVYRGEHVSMGTLAPERTACVYSFSKAYGMAGNRVGYLVGPPAWVDQAHKIGTHTYYSAPTVGQLAGLRALEDGRGWQERALGLYREAGEDAAAVLGLPAPEGSTFLFVDAGRALDARGLPGLLEDCFADGVLVAPGASAGSDYRDWIRLCYTSAPPEIVAGAVRSLARRLGRECPEPGG